MDGRRKIKRDIIDIPKKGVADPRLDCDANIQNLARESSADGADSVPAQSGAPVWPAAREALTSVDGQLTSPTTPSPGCKRFPWKTLLHIYNLVEKA